MGAGADLATPLFGGLEGPLAAPLAALSRARRDGVADHPSVPVLSWGDFPLRDPEPA